MANPRKFSEKIAIQRQKQAEETAAFEQIMRDVISATRGSNHASSSTTTTTTAAANHLRINTSVGNCRAESLPDVNRIGVSPERSSIDLKEALNHLNDMRTGRDPVRRNPSPHASRSPNRHHISGAGQRSSFTERSRGGSSPYSPVFLSPPTDVNWRRTNSDSALHQTGLKDESTGTCFTTNRATNLTGNLKSDPRELDQPTNLLHQTHQPQPHHLHQQQLVQQNGIYNQQSSSIYLSPNPVESSNWRRANSDSRLHQTVQMDINNSQLHQLVNANNDFTVTPSTILNNNSNSNSNSSNSDNCGPELLEASYSMHFPSHNSWDPGKKISLNNPMAGNLLPTTLPNDSRPKSTGGLPGITIETLDESCNNTTIVNNGNNATNNIHHHQHIHSPDLQNPHLNHHYNHHHLQQQHPSFANTGSLPDLTNLPFATSLSSTIVDVLDEPSLSPVTQIMANTMLTDAYPNASPSPESPYNCDSSSSYASHHHQQQQQQPSLNINNHPPSPSFVQQSSVFTQSTFTNHDGDYNPNNNNTSNNNLISSINSHTNSANTNSTSSPSSPVSYTEQQQQQPQQTILSTYTSHNNHNTNNSSNHNNNNHSNNTSSPSSPSSYVQPQPSPVYSQFTPQNTNHNTTNNTNLIAAALSSHDNSINNNLHLHQSQHHHLTNNNNLITNANAHTANATTITTNNSTASSNLPVGVLIQSNPEFSTENGSTILQQCTNPDSNDDYSLLDFEDLRMLSEFSG